MWQPRDVTGMQTRVGSHSALMRLRMEMNTHAHSLPWKRWTMTVTQTHIPCTAGSSTGMPVRSQWCWDMADIWKCLPALPHAGTGHVVWCGRAYCVAAWQCQDEVGMTRHTHTAPWWSCNTTDDRSVSVVLGLRGRQVVVPCSCMVALEHGSQEQACLHSHVAEIRHSMRANRCACATMQQHWTQQVCKQMCPLPSVTSLGHSRHVNGCACPATWR